MPETVQDKDLGERFARYVEDQMDAASNVEVTQLSRIHGGASRETFKVDIRFKGPSGIEKKGLILRKDPPDSLIDTDRKVEFAAIRSMVGAGIPAPEALFLEPNGDYLGSPFFVMGRIEGGETLNPFKIEESEPHRADIGRDFFRHLGAIAKVDPLSSPLAQEIDIPALDACWSRELEHWENEINQNARAPQPIACAAIRHLRRNPPPPRSAFINRSRRLPNRKLSSYRVRND